MSDDDDELFRVGGHVKELRWRLDEDARQREEAENKPKNQNVILTKRDVQGEWDASRTLFTTMGGKVRPITRHDMALFRQNMRVARASFRGEGITPQQIIDVSAATPLNYKNPDDNNGCSNDLEKARREIRVAIPVSIRRDELRIKTSASGSSGKTSHIINVKMNAMNEAGIRLASVKAGDDKAIKRVANWLRKQKMAFECDCERHRYFFRYLATIGGFAAGRQELGYPKIRNPHLRGVACKHVIRAMSELQSSAVFEQFLIMHLKRLQASDNNRANSRLSQKEANAIQGRPARTRQINTTDDREARNRRERARRAELRALQQAVQSAPRVKSVANGSPAKATRRGELADYARKLQAGAISHEDFMAELARQGFV